MSKDDIAQIGQKAIVLLEKMLNKNVEDVVSVTRDEDGWKVVAEILDRKAIPDTQDIISMYEVTYGDDLTVTGYRRIGIRHRGDMMMEEEAMT
jgi:hypothetical protein